MHAVGSLTRSFLLRVRLGADLVILLADVARRLTSVTVLTEEAFYDYGSSRPEILRLLISTSILSSTGLPKSLDELGLRRDGLDRAWHYESLLSSALPVVIVLAGALTLEHWLFRNELTLLCIIDQEVADLAHVTIGQPLVRLILLQRSSIHLGGMLHRGHFQAVGAPPSRILHLHLYRPVIRLLVWPIALLLLLVQGLLQSVGIVL